jgi:hypothetical protein
MRGHTRGRLNSETGLTYTTEKETEDYPWNVLSVFILYLTAKSFNHRLLQLSVFYLKIASLFPVLN